MNTQINDEQWKKVYDKYKNLIYTVCHRISGDSALCTVEDLEADLNIIALESIETYGRKNNVSFDEFFDTPTFHKYIKTCLWNYKNSKGAKITKKRMVLDYNRANFDVEGNSLRVFKAKKGLKRQFETDALWSIEDKKNSGSCNLETEVKDFLFSLSEEEKKIVSIIVEDPNLVKANGKINRLAICQKENKPWKEIDRQLNSLSKKLGAEL
jgi:hypothetical protein